MQTNQKAFDDMAELSELADGLARASRHPLFTDLGREYEDRDMSIKTQTKARLDDDLEHLEQTVVWNNRDNEMSYIGSRLYNLIQHREVIEAIVAAVDNTVGSIDKGVIRDYGSKVDGILVFGNQEEAVINVEDLVGDGYVPPEGSDWVNDRLGLSARFRNSFDGGTRLGGSTMGYRYICGNWMVWGEEEIASKDELHLRRNNEDIGIDPSFFESIIYEVFEEKEELEDTIKYAVEDGEFPTSWSYGLLEDAGFGRNYRKAIARQLNEFDPGEETNLWWLYNAATTYLDSETYLDAGNGVYNKHQSRAWNILETEPEPPEEEVELAAVV